MTLTPINALETGELDAYAPGVIDKYSAPELDQITRVRQAGEMTRRAKQTQYCEWVRLKLMLDGQDTSEGVKAYNIHQSSRFWDGSKAGHFGPDLQDIAKRGDRTKIARLVWANDAAAKLLGSSVANATLELPLQSAAKLGIGHSTLEIYGSLSDDAREIADFYYEQRGELKADMLKEFRQICDSYAERKNELLEGLADGSLKYPSHIQELMVEWETQKREQSAAQRALDEAASLALAENKEMEADNYTPSVSTDLFVGDQADNVSHRKTPSKTWYQSPAGKQTVEKVVGNLAAPLPDLIGSLADLSKALDDQFAHASVMHNYTEFWAGYDKFYYAPNTVKVKWGSSGGRLRRMQKLRDLLKELAGKVEVYINSTTPPDELEYPEE